MSVVVYDDINYSGESITIEEGNYNRNYLRDIYHGNFEKNISSMRVSRNTILLLSSSSHPTGYGDNRVIIGPQNISNLNTILFDNKINSLKVRRFKETDWGVPASVVIYNNYNYTGKHKNLKAGEYSSARIAAKENNSYGITDGNIRSLTVANNTLVILYDGPNFENNNNAVYIEGPINVGDLSKYSMDGKLSSLKVFSIDKPSDNTPSDNIMLNNTPSYDHWYKRQWSNIPEMQYPTNENNVGKKKLLSHTSDPQTQKSTTGTGEIIPVTIHSNKNTVYILLVFIMVLIVSLLITFGIYYFNYTPYESIIENIETT
jgi:hypothetical protein